MGHLNAEIKRSPIGGLVLDLLVTLPTEDDGRLCSRRSR